AHTSITITGASNPAYNGTFSLFPDLGTAYYYPSYAGLYGSPDNEGRLFFAIGATHFIQIGLYAHPTTQGAAVTVGSAISTSDFSNTEVRPTNGDNATTFIFGINNDPNGTGDLAISSGAFTPTTVPEASAPALLAAGLAVFAIRRRSR
ncbi:MAG: hypothetical protein JWO82_4186, partial [Akkermansiaceae bacterium]|nr:hypothetical protein [Akkermansiaceae bacterium]